MERVRVIAHRGASDDVPEHTLAAYRQALADGADGLECDVRMTRDGVLVCVHDRSVNRTSDGRGVVSGLELADLNELDFSSWRRVQRKRPAWQRDPSLLADVEEPDWDARSVLTLERLLQLVAETERPVELAIETKHPTRYAGLVEQTLCELLTSYGLAGRPEVRVMSFSSSSLRRVHALAPGVPTVLLLRRVPARLRSGHLPPRIPIAGPWLAVVKRSPWLVERLHAAGHEVHVWTVDRPADVALMAELGVDALITNRPRSVREQLQELGVR